MLLKTSHISQTTFHKQHFTIHNINNEKINSSHHRIAFHLGK